MTAAQSTPDSAALAERIAEIGNSTQKLHARGPIALRELCTFKYVVQGDGHIRP